jgi:hypothetical protein
MAIYKYIDPLLGSCNGPSLPEDQGLSPPSPTEDDIFLSDPEDDLMDQEMPLDYSLLDSEDEMEISDDSCKTQIASSLCDDNCVDPGHVKSGLFYPLHTPFNTPREYLRSVKHVISLLVSKRDGEYYTCILCPDLAPTRFDMLTYHVELEHGHLGGNTFSKIDCKRKISELAEKRCVDNNKSEVPLVCNSCNMHFETYFEIIFHAIIGHPSLDSAINFCPLCYAPLFSETLAQHWNSVHCNTMCCNLFLGSLPQFLNHNLREHFIEILQSSSKNIIDLMIKGTKDNKGILLWEPAIRKILLTERDNPLMPGLYSKSFMDIVEDCSSTDSSLGRILLPFEGSKTNAMNFGGRYSLSATEYDIKTDAIWQDNINKVLAGNMEKLKIVNKNIMSEDLSKSTEYNCMKCRDYDCHRSTSAQCVDYVSANPLTHELYRGEVTLDVLKEHHGILVGVTSKCFGYGTDNSDSKYKILNLSDLSIDPAYATGYVAGNSVIFHHSKHYKYQYRNFTRHVRNVCSLLPKGTTIPVFVEFFTLPHGRNPTRLSIYYDVIAFVDEIVKIRTETGVPIVILPPIRKYVPGMASKDYMDAHLLAMHASYILTAVCCKVFMPVAPTYGEILPVSTQFLNTGPWTLAPGQLDEPVFNPIGTVTREYRKRLSRFLDEIMDSWAKTVSEMPTLRRNNFFNIINGYSSLPHVPTACHTTPAGQDVPPPIHINE